MSRDQRRHSPFNQPHSSTAIRDPPPDLEDPDKLLLACHLLSTPARQSITLWAALTLFLARSHVDTIYLDPAASSSSLSFVFILSSVHSVFLSLSLSSLKPLKVYFRCSKCPKNAKGKSRICLSPVGTTMPQNGREFSTSSPSAGIESESESISRNLSPNSKVKHRPMSRTIVARNLQL
jgi:hypothetical protein